MELNKPLSPVFQVTHRFLMGSRNDYNFASVFAHDRVPFLSPLPFANLLHPSLAGYPPRRSRQRWKSFGKSSSKLALKPDFKVPIPG